MNQDSFRKLITTPHPSSLSTPSRIVGQSTKSELAFQPRKVKKRQTNSGYRDRASERRSGVNDYAEVESVLENFEKKTAAIEDRDVVEEQRRYLGGDTDHTILVKGLDFALLEQTKTRSLLSHEDDDTLEAAFQEAQPKSILPKKRTREDLIRELKEKRSSASTDATAQEPKGDKAFEEARKIGKFKPIGAMDQPSGQEHSKTAKGSGRDKMRGEGKKKRRKVRQGLVTTTDRHDNETPLPHMTMPTPSEAPKLPLLPPPEASTDIPDAVNDPESRLLEPNLPHVDEVNIFSDASEYEGVDFGEGEDEENEERLAGSVGAEERVISGLMSDGFATVKSWFTEDEPASTPRPSVASPTLPTTEYVPAEPEEPESKPVTRLAPLASSALPSISDFLAMDAQAEAQKKRKAKKEKKKGGEKKEKTSTEAKVDRDYKKLNSYLTKKGDGLDGV